MTPAIQQWVKQGPALYGTLAETGEVLYMGLREGCRYTSYGTKEVLPGIIDRVGDHFLAVLKANPRPRPSCFNLTPGASRTGW